MAIQNPWDATWGADPLGTDVISFGDNEIVNAKDTIRDVLRVEHDIGDATVGTGNFTDTGRHIVGSARAFFFDQTTWVPQALLDPTNAGAWHPTSVQAQTDRSASGILDNGRLWIDWDDGQPYVREQEQTGGAWSPCNVAAGTSATAWVSLWPRQWSVTHTANNDDQGPAAADTREPIDGTYDCGAGGAWATTMGVEIAVPDDGKVYEIEVKATISFADTSNADRVFGFWLVEDPNSILTAPGPTDVHEKLGVIRNTIDTHEVELTYLQTAPVNGDTYSYIVEFAEEHGNASSVINPSTASTTYAGAVDIVGTTSRSRIIATIRPRNLTAAYTV